MRFYDTLEYSIQPATYSSSTTTTTATTIDNERCRSRVKTFTSNGNQQAIPQSLSNRRSKSVSKQQKYDNYNAPLKFNLNNNNNNNNYPYLNENEQIIASTISNSANHLLFKSINSHTNKTGKRNEYLENVTNGIDDDFNQRNSIATDGDILDNCNTVEFNLTSKFIINNNNDCLLQSTGQYEMMDSSDCIVQNRTPSKVALKKTVYKCKRDELMKSDMSSTHSDLSSNLEDSLMEEDGKFVYSINQPKRVYEHFSFQMVSHRLHHPAG